MRHCQTAAAARISNVAEADQASVRARRCWRNSCDSRSSFGMPRMVEAKSAAASVNFGSRADVESRNGARLIHFGSLGNRPLRTGGNGVSADHTKSPAVSFHVNWPLVTPIKIVSTL